MIAGQTVDSGSARGDRERAVGELGQVVTRENAIDLGLRLARVQQIHHSIRFEPTVSIGSTECFGPIRIGSYSYVGPQSELWHCSIGRFCAIAPRVVIGPTEHPLDLVSIHPFQYAGTQQFTGDAYYERIERRVPLAPAARATSIGHDVWIGQNVVVKRGVQVGHGAVIGAGSVVTGDVAPYAIVGGVPARLIRSRFAERIVRELLDLQWWDCDLRDMDAALYADPERFIAFAKATSLPKRCYDEIELRQQEATCVASVIRADATGHPTSFDSVHLHPGSS
jgi:acetyltransferase-like isoleucine patch superfamily enzyme